MSEVPPLVPPTRADQEAIMEATALVGMVLQGEPVEVAMAAMLSQICTVAAHFPQLRAEVIADLHLNVGLIEAMRDLPFEQAIMAAQAAQPSQTWTGDDLQRGAQH